MNKCNSKIIKRILIILSILLGTLALALSIDRYIYVMTVLVDYAEPHMGLNRGYGGIRWIAVMKTIINVFFLASLPWIFYGLASIIKMFFKKIKDLKLN
ncbi:MAG: hypothetical protein ABIA04_16495 [Pseudomonadota bacterium]